MNYCFPDNKRIILDKKLKSCLFVISTPIGNMEDITFRAIKVLSCVNLIVAEDTRLTNKLLSYYGIKAKLLSMNEHNEAERIPKIINKIKSSFNVALVSNAGTPLISDPGFRLVRKAIENFVQIVPVPGPSAVVSAISVAGLPSDSFIFLGFPARKRGKRLDQLKQMSFEKRTFVFYESPRRIVKFLGEIWEILGDRHVVLSREMTKIHEEFIRGKISTVLSKLKNRDKIKGEITLIVSGNFKDEKINDNTYISNLIIKYIKNDTIRTTELSKYISKKYNLPRSTVYDMIIKIKKDFE